MARQAMFDGLIVDEFENPVVMAVVGGEAQYVVDDDGFTHPYGPTQVLKTGCLPCRVLAGAGIVLVLLAL